MSGPEERSAASLHTLAVHAGRIEPRPGTPSAPPIVTASGWSHADMQALDAALGASAETADPAEAGYVYARNGAPTQEALEAALASLEGGAGAAVFASGMAALHAALLAALDGQPPKIVAALEVYGATQTLVRHLAAQAGLSVLWVNARQVEAAAQALSAPPAGGVLLFEVISNPLCRLADAPALLQAARAAGARSVVDSTFTTPYLIQPLALGADLVAHSATKYLGGHGDVLAGAVIAGDQALAARLRRLRTLLGSNLSPFDAYLTLRGLRTLPLRVREQNRNALGLAEWLAAHPRVSTVHYAGLPASPDHALARRVLRPGHFGAMLAFDLAGQAATAAQQRAEVFAFMERLRVIQRIASLGDVATLASYPAHASHRALSAEQRAALGIGDRCVRLSAGIEALEDLTADLAQALA